MKSSQLTFRMVFSVLIPVLWSDTKVLKTRLFFSMICILLSIGLNIYIPLCLRDIINSLSAGIQYQVTFSLIAYGFIWSMGQVIVSLREMLMFKAIQRSIRLFCVALLKHLHLLSFQFHAQIHMGKVTNSIERAQQALPNFVWGTAFLIIPTTIEIITATMVIYYYYNLIYALVLFFTLFIFASFSIFSMKVSFKAEQESNVKELEASSRLVDSLLNYKTVKYFHNQKFEEKKCDSALAEREIYTTKTLLILEGVKIIQGVILGIGLFILLFIAGKEVVLGTLQISDFVLLNGYVIQFASPLTLFGFVLKEAQQSFVDICNIVEIIEQPLEITDKADAANIDFPIHEVSFRNISFGYTPNRFIIKDMSFSLSVGKTTAIVGVTGAGKSTLAHLLLRFYDVNGGAITINNQNVQDIKQEELVKNIVIVPQDIGLFHATIYENVVYAKPNASVAEVMHALKAACFDIGNFPEGLNTIVGERGAKLSQGEKQRLALARLFLCNPEICILDEFTSSLDPRTEKKVQENLANLFKNKTFLIIAHRLRTIAHADQIIVIDQGKIVEIGTHGTLLEKQGVYALLWQEQQSIMSTGLQNSLNK